MTTLIRTGLSGGQECVMCPYDPSHSILVHRLAVHLTRCKKRNTHLRKVTCPFNVVHVVDRFEIEAHIRNCPNNDILLNIISIDGPPTPVGTVPFEELSEQQTLVDEDDWNGDHPTYNPVVATQNKDIIRMPSEIQSKKEKKQRRHEERDRIIQVERKAVRTESVGSQKQYNAKPLRAPKDKAKAVVIADEATENIVPNFEHLNLQGEPLKKTETGMEERKNLSRKNNVLQPKKDACERNEFVLKVLGRIRDAQLDV